MEGCLSPCQAALALRGARPRGWGLLGARLSSAGWAGGSPSCLRGWAGLWSHVAARRARGRSAEDLGGWGQVQTLGFLSVA